MPDTFGIPTGPIDREPLDYPTPGVFPSATEREGILRDTLHAAGVELGAYDKRIVDWLAGWEWSTLAVIASWVARAAASREPAPTVALPGRFDATPAEVDRHLRRILAEDTYLRYQQVIGNLAVSEAAKDLRMEHAAREADAEWMDAADHIDPAKGGGHYPSQLLCSQHNGFGPCPGAPRCTPKEDLR